MVDYIETRFFSTTSSNPLNRSSCASVLGQRFFKRRLMDLAGKMNRAFTADRIPRRWVGRTKVLRFQAYLCHRFFDAKAGDTVCRPPGGAAGSASNHPDPDDSAVLDRYVEFRSAEMGSVITEADLPPQAASGERCKNPFDSDFFPRRHNGSSLFDALNRKIA